MQKVIREILVYMLFLYLLMTVGYGNRDPWGHSLYDACHSVFGQGYYGDKGGPAFSAVSFSCEVA